MTHEHTSIWRMAPLHMTRLCRAYSRHADGFSLIELMLAVSIVGVLAALAVPNYMAFIEKALVARAISELHGLAKDIKGFALAVGTYPNSLTDVGVGTRLDPWGTPYRYYRINCGRIDDITGLAKLKLRRKNSPRVVPAVHLPSTQDDWHSAFANSNSSDQQARTYLVTGGGAGSSGGAESSSATGSAGGTNGSGTSGAGAASGGEPPCAGVSGARKDRFLVPINSDFDVYSMGQNLDTVAPLNPPKSQDDVIRASDGGFYGLARNF